MFFQSTLKKQRCTVRTGVCARKLQRGVRTPQSLHFLNQNVFAGDATLEQTVRFYRYITFQLFLFSRFVTDTDVQQEVRTLPIARRQTSDFVVQGTHNMYHNTWNLLSFVINYRNSYQKSMDNLHNRQEKNKIFYHSLNGRLKMSKTAKFCCEIL